MAIQYTGLAAKVDVNGNVAIIDPVSGAEKKVWAASTDAAIRAAALSLYNAGGGDLEFGNAPVVGGQSVPIRLLAPLPLYQNFPVRYIGRVPTTVTQNPANGSYSQGFEWFWTGGTVLQGDGTFSAFAPARNGGLNGADDADVGVAQANVGNTEITGINLYGIGLHNFSRGISAGAQNVIGLIHGTMDELYMRNCGWASYLVNFGALRIGKLYGVGDPVAAQAGQNGFYFAQKGNQNVIGLCGSTTIDHLFWVRPRYAGLQFGRNVVFEALSVGGGLAGLSEIHIDRLETDTFGPPTLTSVVATITNLSPNIALPAGTGAKLRVGMPVWFTTSGATFNGLPEPTDGGTITYIVTSIVGDTIQLSSSRYGAAINGGANEAPTMQFYGYANLDIIGDATSTVTNITIRQLDSEGYAASAYLDRVGGVEIGITTAASQAIGPHIVGRNIGRSKITAKTDIKTDMDGASTGAIFEGGNTQRWGYGVPGKYLDASSGHNVYKAPVTPVGRITVSGINAGLASAGPADVGSDTTTGSIPFVTGAAPPASGATLFTLTAAPGQTNPGIILFDLDPSGAGAIRVVAEGRTGNTFTVKVNGALLASTAYTLKYRVEWPT